MTDPAIAKVWPVDFDTLQKGDVVNGRVLAAEWGLNLQLTEDADRFKFKMLALCEAINQTTLHRGLIAEFRKYNIRILTDREYSTKQAKLTATGTRKLMRAVKMPAPDLSQLTPAEIAQWDSGDRFAQRNAAKLLEAKRDVEAIRKALKAGVRRPALRT